MDQRVNIITLGVDDVPRARAFYEQLGWELDVHRRRHRDVPGRADGRLAVGSHAARRATAASPTTGGWGGFTLGYAVEGPEQVDAVCAQAAEAGATVTRPPVEKPFGYSGVFADPDGHTWEVAYIKGLALHEDGTVALGAAA